MEWVDEVLDKVRKDFIDEEEELTIDYKFDRFSREYDFNDKPSEDILERDEVQDAKTILDLAFRQWLAWEENSAEYVFDESFHQTIDCLPHERLLEMFEHYFEGFLKGYISSQKDN